VVPACWLLPGYRAWAVLVVLFLLVLAAPAGAHVLPENAAATHAYLVATNSFEEMEVAGLPREIAAREAVAAGISGECPSILTNAPPHEEVFGFGLTGPASHAGLSPRAQGEKHRQSEQLGGLKLELSLALAGSRTQAGREAALTLIRALTPLKWSNREITLLLHLTIEGVKEELDVLAPPACADMKAWVASGYKALSPASKEVASRSETLLKRAFEFFGLVTQIHIQPFPKNLVPYENTADRALARHSEALTVQLKKGRETQHGIVKRLEAAVGLPPTKARKLKRPATKSVVIARGRTAAGGSFVAKAEPPPHGLRGRHCTVEVSITEPSHPSGGLLELLNGSSPERCLSRSARVAAAQSVHCDAGLLTVEAGLPATVTSVRLLLSDNRTVTSKAIRVPRRLGGPEGLYYQVVRGPSPIPVSLTELDAHGNTLAVLKLPAVVECTKKEKNYFPGGIVQLAHGSLPQGPSFKIRAERYRELGHIHFKLKFTASNEESLTGPGGGDFLESTGAAEAEGVSSVFSGRPIQSSQTFERQTSSGCLPQPYAIIYGLLRAPRDTVFARVSGTLVALNNIVIPARLHAGGVLAYHSRKGHHRNMRRRSGSPKLKHAFQPATARTHHRSRPTARGATLSKWWDDVSVKYVRMQ
jgi:hypothetical protein